MADLVNESLETIKAKLDDYKANREAIAAALEAEPDNQELKKLDADLEEVITFFSEMAAIKEAEMAVPASAPAAPEESSPSIEPAPGALSLIGRTCVSTESGNGLYFGQIRQLGPLDPSTALPDSVHVTWFATSTTELVPVPSLRLVTPMPADQLRVGMTLQALWGEDGQWYRCTLKSISKEGYHVTYVDYGNEETVPADRLRPEDTKIAAPKKKTTAPKEITTPGGYKVPVSLLAKATDSEAQKAEKKRRLNKLKREQREAAEDAEARARQNSWQSHVKKSLTKPTHRVGLTLLHSSKDEKQ